MASLTEVGGILGGIAALAAAAIGLRRKGRGRVRDTEAETLWAQLAHELDAVRVEVREYRDENIQLRAALVAANEKADKAQAEAERLRARVAHLEAKLAAVERRENGGTL